jgi:hypothetical protein
MDAVVTFRANGEATKPAEPGERAFDDPAEHAKTAGVGRATTAEDRNNAVGGEAITTWLRIVAMVALQDVGPSARPRTATGLRKQRLETRPQRIVQEGLCHARPYQVDHASTRDQSEVLKRALSN